MTESHSSVLTANDPRTSALLGLLACQNYLVSQSLFDVVARTESFAQRARIIGLAAGHVNRGDALLEDEPDPVTLMEQFAGPLDEFMALTTADNREQLIVRLLIIVGFQQDLAEAMGDRVDDAVSKLISTQPEIWRTIDWATEQTMAAVEEDPNSVGLLSLYGRRVGAETILTTQAIAARDTNISNALSGRNDDGLDDLAGVSAVLEPLLTAAFGRLRQAGLRA